VLAEIDDPREHVLVGGAAQPRHLHVSGGRARGEQLAPTPYVGLFSRALSAKSSVSGRKSLVHVAPVLGRLDTSTQIGECVGLELHSLEPLA
jgi:hypothetical protein